MGTKRYHNDITTERWSVGWWKQQARDATGPLTKNERAKLLRGKKGLNSAEEPEANLAVEESVEASVVVEEPVEVKVEEVPDENLEDQVSQPVDKKPVKKKRSYKRKPSKK
jgi:hypothetical protein